MEVLPNVAFGTCCTHNNLPLNLTIYWENSKGTLSKCLNPTTYGGFRHVYTTTYANFAYI